MSPATYPAKYCHARRELTLGILLPWPFDADHARCKDFGRQRTGGSEETPRRHGAEAGAEAEAAVGVSTRSLPGKAWEGDGAQGGQAAEEAAARSMLLSNRTIALRSIERHSSES